MIQRLSVSNHQTKTKLDVPQSIWLSQWLYERIEDRCFPQESVSEAIRRLLFYVKANPNHLNKTVSVIPWYKETCVKLRFPPELLDWVDRTKGRSRQQKVNRLLSIAIIEMPEMTPIYESRELLFYIKKLLEQKEQWWIYELEKELLCYASSLSIREMIGELSELGFLKVSMVNHKKLEYCPSVNIKDKQYHKVSIGDGASFTVDL